MTEHGGRGRYGLVLSLAPSEAIVNSWTLGDLLHHLEVTACYPGLTEAAVGNAHLHINAYDAAHGRLGYSIFHPLTVDPLILDHLRDPLTTSAKPTPQLPPKAPPNPNATNFPPPKPQALKAGRLPPSSRPA